MIGRLSHWTGSSAPNTRAPRVREDQLALAVHNDRFRAQFDELPVPLLAFPESLPGQIERSNPVMQLDAHPVEAVEEHQAQREDEHSERPCGLERGRRDPLQEAAGDRKQLRAHQQHACKHDAARRLVALSDLGNHGVEPPCEKGHEPEPTQFLGVDHPSEIGRDHDRHREKPERPW